MSILNDFISYLSKTIIKINLTLFFVVLLSLIFLYFIYFIVFNFILKKTKDTYNFLNLSKICVLLASLYLLSLNINDKITLYQSLFIVALAYLICHILYFILQIPTFNKKKSKENINLKQMLYKGFNDIDKNMPTDIITDEEDIKINNLYKTNAENKKIEEITNYFDFKNPVLQDTTNKMTSSPFIKYSTIPKILTCDKNANDNLKNILSKKEYSLKEQYILDITSKLYLKNLTDYDKKQIDNIKNLLLSKNDSCPTNDNTTNTNVNTINDFLSSLLKLMSKYDI